MKTSGTYRFTAWYKCLHFSGYDRRSRVLLCSAQTLVRIDNPGKSKTEEEKRGVMEVRNRRVAVHLDRFLRFQNSCVFIRASSPIDHLCPSMMLVAYTILNPVIPSSVPISSTHKPCFGISGIGTSTKTRCVLGDSGVHTHGCQISYKINQSATCFSDRSEVMVKLPHACT
jgi:hypothetical protein